MWCVGEQHVGLEAPAFERDTRVIELFEHAL